MKTRTKSKPKPPPSTPLPPGTEEYLTIEDIARALRVSRDYLRKLRATGDYPPPDRELAGGPRWRVETHNRWVRSTDATAEHRPVQ